MIQRLVHTKDDDEAIASKEQQQFWQELVQLKSDICYIRDHRNQIGQWATRFATLRAITSAGSIALWAVWKEHAYIWACLIAFAQVADALKDVFPISRRRDSLSRWCGVLNRLFVGAQRDWDDIAGGVYTNQQIRKLLYRLRLAKQQTESRYAPNGLPKKESLFLQAQSEAVAFFESKYDS